MITTRRAGSMGRNTRGCIAGAASAAATGGGAARAAAAGGLAAIFGAGIGLAAGGLLAAGASGADATGVGGTEAAGAGGGMGAAAAAGAGAGEIALTAAWQPPESFARLRLRHSKASLPPGCTPEQFAMKSERQEERMASRCVWVGCCAATGLSRMTLKIAAIGAEALVATAAKIMVPP